MKLKLEITGFGQELYAGKTVSWFEVELPEGRSYRVQVPNALYAEFSERMMSAAGTEEEGE